MPPVELDLPRARQAPLPREFFSRPSPLVARELLGCWMVRRLGDQELRVRISETEAYLGPSDPASHAYRGLTPRNAPMFGIAGTAYVYFVYGMHHCFNVVTGEDGDPQAVLVRGAVGRTPEEQVALRGPALLCRALGIDLSCNGMDLCHPGASPIWFESGNGRRVPILVTPRVGVKDPSRMRFLVTPQPGRRDVASKKERAPKGSLH